MAMFRSLVFAAALAGLLTGVLVTIAQQVGTVPLILAAEVFEQADEPAAAAEPLATVTRPGRPRARGLGAEDGFQRNAFTLLANIVTGTAFALLLDCGLRPARAGDRVAPGLVLGPGRLRGLHAGTSHRIAARTARHAGRTVAATTGVVDRHRAGHSRRPAPCWCSARAAGRFAVALMIAPHLIGAPQPEPATTLVPEDLHHRFVVAVTVTSFSWIALGVSSAWFERFRADRTQPA